MVPIKVQPLLLKRKVPDYGQSQRENHLHSKTRLLDYHDSAANVVNSAFYFNGFTASRPEVAGVSFSDSYSAPVPKFLNPGLDPAILQI